MAENLTQDQVRKLSFIAWLTQTLAEYEWQLTESGDLFITAEPEEIVRVFQKVGINCEVAEDRRIKFLPQ